MNPDEKLSLQVPQSRRRFSKRTIIIAAAVVVLIILFLLLSLSGGGHSGLTGLLTGSASSKNGSIVVKTDDPSNTITVTSTSPGSASTILQSGASQSLAPGSYYVLVEGAYGKDNIVAVIKSGQTSRFNIDLTATPLLEPVADVNAISFAVSPSNIYYVDQDGLGDTLDQIDTNNNLSSLTSDNITYARWAPDGAFGVAQDSNDNLYTVSSGSIAPLNKPGATATGQLVYAVAPNHSIYLAIGPNIYVHNASGWQLVLTAGCTPSIIAPASSGSIALVCGAPDGPGSQGRSGITVVTPSGGHIQKAIDADSAAWSPDGSHLVTTSSTASNIYDSSLNSVATIPNSFGEFPATPVWANNTSVLFNLNDQLWEFSINGSSTSDQLLTTTGSSQSITNIVLDSARAYAYLTMEATSGSSQDLQIWRYGLHDQPVARATQTLGNNFPNLQGRCLLGLVNFTSPAAIQSFGGKPEDNCPSVAQSYVQSLQVNPSTVNYYTTSLPPDESPGN